MLPTILLLHGALNTSTQFASLSQKLEPYFDVHTLDFSGHGQVAFGGAMDMKVLVRDISQYLEQIDAETCHIFGYSMGGYAALSFASNKPEKLGKIITLGTKWDWDPTTSAKEVAMLDPEVMVEKVPSYVEKLQAMFGENNWINVVRNTAALMLDLGHGGGMVEDNFKTIETKVLILRGAEDKMVSAESSKDVASWLRNATYAEIDGAPHPLEKVDVDVLVG
ncbi:MAG TPA: alpha/beta hydrolase, partial [Saprospiraceae bacterium]|nr:alpha/beta hydrolase [Saprospiraceae bacterium]